MTGSSAAEKGLPTGLVVAVIAMTLSVMALGAVVLVIQLQPPGVPETQAERDIAIWEQRVGDNPDSSWAHTGLGTAFEDAGRIGEARAEFEKAIALHPAEWLALLRLGVLDMEGDPASAERYLARSAEAAPRNSRVSPYMALGDLRMAQGDADGARKAYEGAVANAPYIYTAHFGLAQALEALGDIDGAIEQYRRAADFNPSSPEVAAALARLDATEATP
ncbi:MAG: tetratricopeptide repeat protein [Actinomycetota bacterium]